MTDALRAEAANNMRAAEAVLRDESLGEMERQIEQSRLMELAYCQLQQVAIATDDTMLLRIAADNAQKWAAHMRSATTKRKNDIVPLLVQAVTDGASWSEAASALAKRQSEKPPG